MLGAATGGVRSHWRCYVRKDALINFAKSTEKHLSLFFDKVAGLRPVYYYLPMLISKTVFPSLMLIKTFSNLLKNVNFVIEKSISHLTTETKFEPLLASRPKRLFSCLKSKTLYVCLFSPFSSPRSLWKLGNSKRKSILRPSNS